MQLTGSQEECAQLETALEQQKEATNTAKATTADHVQSQAKKYAHLSKFLKQWGNEEIRVGESIEWTVNNSMEFCSPEKDGLMMEYDDA